MVRCSLVLLAASLLSALVSCTPPGDEGAGVPAARDAAFSLDDDEQAWVDTCRARGGLRVATVLQPGSFEDLGDGTYGGFNAGLASALAETLKLPLSYRIRTFESLFHKDGALPAGTLEGTAAPFVPDILSEADFVAFDLSALEWRKRLMDFVPTYPVRQLLLAPRGKEIRQLGDLEGRTVAVVGSSSHEGHARFLSRELGIGFRILPVPFGENRFELVRQGKADFLVAESNAAMRLLGDNSDFNACLPLSNPVMNNWALARDNTVLRGLLIRWMDWARAQGILDRLWSSSYRVSMEDYLRIIAWTKNQDQVWTAAEKEVLGTLKARGGLRAAIDQEQTIYELKDDGRRTGLHYNLLLALANSLELPLDISPVRFTQFFEKNGVVPEAAKTAPSFNYRPDLLDRVDMYVASLSPLPWRQKFLAFIPLYPAKLVWVSRMEDKEKKLQDAPATRFSLLPDTSYEGWMKERGYFDADRIVYASSGLMAIELVASGRADVSLSDSNLIFSRLPRYSGITFYPADDSVDTLSWAVARENTALRTLVEKALDRLRREGTFEILWQEYYKVSFNEYLDLIGVKGD